jgi:hypothetical protein
MKGQRHTDANGRPRPLATVVTLSSGGRLPWSVESRCMRPMFFVAVAVAALFAAVLPPATRPASAGPARTGRCRGPARQLPFGCSTPAVASVGRAVPSGPRRCSRCGSHGRGVSQRRVGGALDRHGDGWNSRRFRHRVALRSAPSGGIHRQPPTRAPAFEPGPCGRWRSTVRCAFAPTRWTARASIWSPTRWAGSRAARAGSRRLPIRRPHPLHRRLVAVGISARCGGGRCSRVMGSARPGYARRPRSGR